MTTIKEAQDRVDEFPHVKSWELDKDKFVVDATPDEIKALIEQTIKEERASIYQQQGDCRLRNMFSHRIGKCLCYDPSRLKALMNITDITQEELEEMAKEMGKRNKIKEGAEDFAERFEDTFRGLAEEEHRTFETGSIRDKEDGKEDYTETISWTAFRRYAEYMTKKKEKYGSGNFKKGIPIESYERSMHRHIQKYMENKYEEGDREAGEDHLSGAVFNIFGIMHEEEMAKKRNQTPTNE